MATGQAAVTDHEPSESTAEGHPGRVSLAGRISWLLRSNRLLGPDPKLVRAKTFAAAFHGGCWPTRTTESRISRWETAVVPPPHAAVARYEELLSLPPCTLTSAVDILYRYAARPGDGPPTLARPITDPVAAQRRLDELLDRALSTATMNGRQWDELSALIVTLPQVIIAPSSARSTLAERLVAEMIVAHGVAWMQRFEALNRLLGHRSCAPAVVAACASLGADRDNQIFIETIGALDGSRLPDASRHVLAQLHHPTNDRALLGALVACVRKIRFGHFTTDQLAELTPLISDLLMEPAHRAEARPLAAALLRHHPHIYRPGVHATLRRAAAADRTIAEVVATGQVVALRTSTAVVTRVVNACAASLPHDLPAETGATFTELVRELLFDPVPDVQIYTAMLLAATPYRRPLAGALAGELASARLPDRLDLNRGIISALRNLGGAAERPVVERIVLSPGLPGPLVDLATHAIGHLDGRSDDRFWVGAVDYHHRQWQRHRGPLHESALRGLVYGLGIARSHALLRQVRDDPTAPQPARRAATWWLRIPRHILVSSTD